MPKIQRNQNSNLFCVPAALSALTGLHVDKCCELIHEEIGDQPITGIYYPLILKILGKLNFTWIDNPVLYAKDKLYLLCYHGHVGVLDNGIYIDNSYPEGTPDHLSGRRLINVFEIIVPEETKTNV